MIPEFTIEIGQDCNARGLKMPEEGLLKHDTGLMCNHDYLDKRGFLWRDAQEALELELRIVEKADANSSTKDEFEHAINEFMENEPDSRVILDEFDVGVAAATMAFSAAGCAPVSSCRGHQINEEPHPYVGGWIDEKRAEILIQICKELNVGIGNYDWECNEGIIIYSRNIRSMIKFAEKVIENARHFHQEKKKRNYVQNTLKKYKI